MVRRRRKYLSAIPHTLTIEVRAWDKWNPNAKPGSKWFKLASDFLDDPDIFQLNPTGKIVYLLLLQYCCKSGTRAPQIRTNVAARALQLRPKSVTRALQELSTLNKISILEQIFDAETPPRLDKIRLDKIRLDKIRLDSPIVPSLEIQEKHQPKKPISELAELWNATFADSKIPTIQLATVKAGSPRHKFLEKRLEDFPDIGWWRELFQKIQASDFLSGRTEPRPGFAWRCATFDWVMNPANLAKIAEGNYDNKTPTETPEARRKREQKEEFDRLYPDRYAEHLKETDPAKYETYMRAVGGAS